jgi:hypothetical protein
MGVEGYWNNQASQGTMVLANQLLKGCFGIAVLKIQVVSEPIV